MAGKAGARKGDKKDQKASEVVITVLARNRKAKHKYEITETIEAGLMLAGSEVKSIRDGKATLLDAYAEIDGKGEAWLHQMDVGAYVFSHARNHEARRRRKLLLHRREIDRIAGLITQKGMTVVPLSLYDKSGTIKIDLALVRGKQDFDRREDVKERESKREMERGMASRRR